MIEYYYDSTVREQSLFVVKINDEQFINQISVSKIIIDDESNLITVFLHKKYYETKRVGDKLMYHSSLTELKEDELINYLNDRKHNIDLNLLTTYGEIYKKITYLNCSFSDIESEQDMYKVIFKTQKYNQ